MDKQAYKFLSAMPHFKMLPEEDLNKLVNHASLQRIAQDTVFAVQDKARIDSILVLQIVIEGFLFQRYVPETQIIQDFPYSMKSKKRGIEFDEGIEPLSLQHMVADGFDLLRRTAVHG